MSPGQPCIRWGEVDHFAVDFMREVEIGMYGSGEVARNQPVEPNREVIVWMKNSTGVRATTGTIL